MTTAHALNLWHDTIKGLERKSVAALMQACAIIPPDCYVRE